MNIDLQRPRDLGRILDDAFALYRANWRTLLLVGLVVVVPVYLVVYGIGMGWLWSAYDEAPAGNELDVSDVTASFAGTAAQLLVVTPLVTAMTVHVVRSAAEGRRLPAGEALGRGLRDFSQLFLAVLLVAAGVMLGLLALIVPGVILAIRWILVAQVVVIERETGTAALRRSFELTRGNAWFTFLTVLVVNLLVGVFTALVLVPLELAAEEANTMALSLLGQVLGTLISLPLVGVAYTLLYYSLLARKEGTAAPPASSAQEPLPAAGEPPAAPPQTLPGVPGTFGDGWTPPTPPDRGPERRS